MNILHILIAAMYVHYMWSFSLAIISSDDVKMNPGPMLHSCHTFSMCHWNLNSLPAHNFIKVSLFQAYVIINKFDIICLSKFYLNSSVLSNDTILDLPSYNLVRADYPPTTKKDCLPLTL